MDYGNVHLVSDKLVLASLEEVAQLEAHLGARLPKGYQEYVATLGLGVLNDTIRVYMPKRIQREYRDFQQRWSEYYFWEAGADILSKAKVLESIIIADTGNGDEVVFHPSETERLYLLPHSEEQIHEVGTSLDEAIEWILHGEVLLEEDEDFQRPEGIYFEPFPPEANQ